MDDPLNIINVISFGHPSTEKLIEWDGVHYMFKCQFDGGNANGSCWRSIRDIIAQQKSVDKYYDSI